MKPLKLKGGKQPEGKIQDKIVNFLRLREWIIMRTHGNKYQSGFPDLYCYHASYGERWLEVKRPVHYDLTPAQLHYFPKIKRVWILTGASEKEYEKLFKTPNWSAFLNFNRVREKYKSYALPPDTPEGTIQKQLIMEAESAGYTVMQTCGDIYQKGFPDLYYLKGDRRYWVEVKNPLNYRFTANQLKYFPLMKACRIPIWILTGIGQLKLLKNPPNWENFR